LKEFISDCSHGFSSLHARYLVTIICMQSHLGRFLIIQHLGPEHELLGDYHKRKLEEQQWEEELVLGLKRSRLQDDSAGRLFLLLY